MRVRVYTKLKNSSLILIDWFFPNIASKIAKFYWMTSDKVHSDTSWKMYEFYYSKIKQLIQSSYGDFILDAACGTGEITWLFYKDGYRIEGFDFSDYLICKAKLNFPQVWAHYRTHVICKK